jgi:hypothetical protein
MWKCPHCGVFIAGAPDPSVDSLDCPHCHGEPHADAAAEDRKSRLTYYGGFLLIGVLFAVGTYLLTEGHAVLIAIGPIIVGLVGLVYHLIDRIPRPTSSAER